MSGGTDPFDPSDPAADSLWARGGDDTFSWHFTPAQTGTYEVWEWHSGWTSRTSAAPHQITHAGGTTNVAVNQKNDAGKWNSLGVYQFTAGQHYRVTVTSVADNSSTCADAVKFTHIGTGNLPPVATIDVITKTAILPGDEISFMGSGSDEGSVEAYEWRSDIDGLLSNQDVFRTTSLSPGTHTIFFRVRDEQNAWSNPATALVVVQDCSSPVAIMPIGDSITMGYGQISDPDLMTGYRAILHQQLVSRGYNIDFVGNRAEGRLVLPPFDINHQGIGGISAAFIASNVYNWLVENPAEIVLLHIGTNAFTTSPLGVEAILNAIDQYEVENSRDVIVILAQIINRKPYHPDTTLFNDNLQAMAEARIVGGDKIVIVDQESALNYSTDMWDKLHPNNLGYAKMPAPWIDELIGLLPTCSVFEPAIFTTPSEQATVGAEYTYQAAALGNPAPTYSLFSAPTGMTIDSITGAISWVPAAGDEGVHTITVRANSAAGVFDQSFKLNVGTVAVTITRDNYDPDTSSTGDWLVSGGTDPFEPGDPAADSLWARGGDDTFSWYFTAAQTGTYEVWEWHSGWSSRTNAAPHQITHAGGSTNVVVNQKINAGRWNSLGVYQFTAGQRYRVTVTSVADNSSTCADAVRWTLVTSGNNPPTAKIDSISPSPANQGEDVVFTGSGTDTDGSIAAYQWSSDIGGILSSSKSFSTSGLAAGTHTITFQVRDDDGAWSGPATGNLTVNGVSQTVIRDNYDPDTSSTGDWLVSGGTDPFEPGDPAADSLWARGGDDTFSWYFTAAQTGMYEVWEWHSGWSSRTNAAPHQITHAGGSTNVVVNQRINAGKWNSLGVYQFTAGQRYRVTVTSVADNSSTCADAVRWTLVTSGNNPPTAKIDSISPNPANQGEDVVFTGSGTDTDGSIAAYQWSSDIGGILSSSKSFSTSGLAAGTHTITFQVRDDDGAWSGPATGNFTVNGVSQTVIRDNYDPDTSSTGEWLVSGGTNPFDPSDPAADSLWARGGDDTFSWYFTADQTGTYEVWEWHSGWSTRTSAAPHQITHAEGTANVAVNQKINAGKWNSLGVYQFTAGQRYRVTVTSVADSSSTCADAVRWTLVTSDN